jgi:hypothetical protein
MSVYPPIRAVVAERLIFNYRLPLDAMKDLLPRGAHTASGGRLEAQDIQGYAVASFCALDLRNITFAPLPAVAGFRSISCAPRYAVADTSSGTARPVVFVSTRFTNCALGSLLTRLSCIAPHPYAAAMIAHEGQEIELNIDGSEAKFHCRMRPARDVRSRLFGSVEEFAAFIAQGVSSYGECRQPSCLTRVDLKKTDAGYEPLDVLALRSPIADRWEQLGGVLDSAFRTHAGLYEWSYRGLVECRSLQPVQERWNRARMDRSAPPMVLGGLPR